MMITTGVSGMEGVITGLVAGAGAGFLGGLFGLGGGVILIPVFTLMMGVPMKVAVGTSLCAVVANSVAAAIRRLRENEVELRLATWLEPTMLVASLVASSLVVFIDQDALARLFAVVLVLVALLVAVRKDSELHGSPVGSLMEANGRPSFGRPFWSVQSVFAVGGVFSGLLGIGGGVFMIPGLTLFARVPMKRAASTSNYAMSLGASGGAIVYLVNGMVDPVLLSCVVLGGTAGTRAGLWMLARVPVRALRVAFAVIMMAIGVQMWLKH